MTQCPSCGSSSVAHVNNADSPLMKSKRKFIGGRELPRRVWQKEVKTNICRDCLTEW